MPLKDVMIDRPRILFVGINPGLRSEAIGHHFGGPANPFWRLLHASGLTPVLLKPEEDRRLKEFGLALTNLCPRASRQASELSAAELAAGKIALARKIRRVRPRLVALVGVSIYKAFFPTGPGGAGPKDEYIADAPLFVLPNPSGLNAAYPGFQHKLVWFEKLRAYATMVPAP
jgi:double-stranded uracil-DNA glycosylase